MKKKKSKFNEQLDVKQFGLSSVYDPINSSLFQSLSLTNRYTAI